MKKEKKQEQIDSLENWFTERGLVDKKEKIVKASWEKVKIIIDGLEAISDEVLTDVLGGLDDRDKLLTLGTYGSQLKKQKSEVKPEVEAEVEAPTITPDTGLPVKEEKEETKVDDLEEEAKALEEEPEVKVEEGDEKNDESGQ